MNVDFAKSPIAYEFRPYVGNYGYPIPYHGCCNRVRFPGDYSFRPPYSHHPSQSPFHCMGSYPTFPGACPVYYAPPPYLMEQPRYEYDKDVPKSYHCFGCPNHMHNLTGDRSVKIEEQEHNVQKKGSNSLVPSELKNGPYTIIWVPPGFLGNKEHQIPSELEMRDKDKFPFDKKPDDNVTSLKQEPRVGNGGLPFHLNSIGSLQEGEGDKIIQSHQDRDKKTQFPFPIIWVPSFDRPPEVERTDSKETNTSSRSVEEHPSNVQIIPVDLPEGDDGKSKHRADEENSKERTNHPKMVPKGRPHPQQQRPSYLLYV